MLLKIGKKTSKILAKNVKKKLDNQLIKNFQIFIKTKRTKLKNLFAWPFNFKKYAEKSKNMINKKQISLFVRCF